MTIHQARSQLINDFDNILLLARGGSLAYTGSTREMLPYFRKQGFECPTSTNPADFVLDLITVDLQEEAKETASRERVQRIIQHWQEEEGPKVVDSMQTTTQIIASPAELNSLKCERNSFWVVFPLLPQRSIINIKRNFEIIMARTMQVIGYGIILALFFAPLKNNYEGIQSCMVCSSLYSSSCPLCSSLLPNSSTQLSYCPLLLFSSTLLFYFSLLLFSSTLLFYSSLLLLSSFLLFLQCPLTDTLLQGFLQEVTPLYFIGMLQNLAVYPTAQRIFLREHADGCYTAPTFLASYTLLELPFTAISSLLFGVISANAIRAKETAGFAFAIGTELFLHRHNRREHRHHLRHAF